MLKKLLSILKPLARPILALALVGALVLSQANAALAARSGGRIGGGSFRRPAPTRTFQRPPTGGGYGYPGGGFGFPFLIPFFGFGGGLGGILSIFVVITVANILVSAFRRIKEGDEGLSDGSLANPPVSINKLQVGLLAEARDLQKDLDQIALKANTSSPDGLQRVLQETTLTLLRHPEYCAYAGVEAEQSRLAAAEARFNHLALSERSKFQAETLSNVKQQVQNASTLATVDENPLAKAPGEYIVVTLLTASQGKLNLPQVNSAETLRQALNQLGAISSDQLLALEVYWTPQAEGDVFTSDDLLTDYPQLKLL
ncbi:DUF1517 domain-containing protein [Synechococcales cyanobacterium C]|uniref:DUF1517 domain-containing protein n=2 Tax=Petrachloros TaxID=2918834 RepID=A0A8K2A0A5_9CYAN|nr:DUF1517 domain-containing protein [Petrachloros mirabilis]NCJ07381.1 DUF1517 domain-containing protein [Petrachloros mirabilis ULC683]